MGLLYKSGTYIIMLVTGQGQALDNTVACSTVVDYITGWKISECPIRWRVKADISAAEARATLKQWDSFIKGPCVPNLQD